MATDEGALDPWVAEWCESQFGTPWIDLATAAHKKIPEIPSPPRRELGPTLDEQVGDIPIRIYHPAGAPTGVIVYFHGGGFCTGSIDVMHNIATELCFTANAIVVSVGYRLAPQHPYPAAVDDCETVTRWVFDHRQRFGAAADRIALAGESAGGTLVASVSLRLRRDPAYQAAAQVLIYPGVDHGYSDHPSRREFTGLLVGKDMISHFWDSYTAGRDLSDDPIAVPLSARSLAQLPPALVILGGCDFLRDEGRLYAERLRSDGVETKEICYPGQPHGFMNLNFPAASGAFDTIGEWLHAKFRPAQPSASRG